LAFEEVAQEVSFAQATHLGHAESGKAPERFNTVHLVFSHERTHFHDDESDDDEPDDDEPHDDDEWWR
jgi:hypothetical protein